MDRDSNNVDQPSTPEEEPQPFPLPPDQDGVVFFAFITRSSSSSRRHPASQDSPPPSRPTIEPLPSSQSAFSDLTNSSSSRLCHIGHYRINLHGHHWRRSRRSRRVSMEHQDNDLPLPELSIPLDANSSIPQVDSVEQFPQEAAALPECSSHTAAASTNANRHHPDVPFSLPGINSFNQIPQEADVLPSLMPSNAAVASPNRNHFGVPSFIPQASPSNQTPQESDALPGPIPSNTAAANSNRNHFGEPSSIAQAGPSNQILQESGAASHPAAVHSREIEESGPPVEGASRPPTEADSQMPHLEESAFPEAMPHMGQAALPEPVAYVEHPGSLLLALRQPELDSEQLMDALPPLVPEHARIERHSRREVMARHLIESFMSSRHFDRFMEDMVSRSEENIPAENQEQRRVSELDIQRLLERMTPPEQPQRGISRQEIESLAPETTILPEQVAGTNMADCCVCLGEIEVGDRTRTLPCTHCLHRDCIDRWVKDHIRCPLCRSNIRPTETNQ